MLRYLLFITTFIVVHQSAAHCPTGCTCISTSPYVECNTIELQPFGKHVFGLKIVHPIEPLNLNVNVFNVTGLENVNKLIIQNANITQIHKFAFSEMPLLSTLELINCNISNIHESAFSKVIGLRTLKISNSTLLSFEGVTSEHIEELVLSGNKLTEVSNKTFTGFPSLTFIDLSDNDISKIDSGAFIKIPFLQEVSFTNNLITDFYSGLFKSNAELVTLDFSNNPLKKFEIDVVADLEKLVLTKCQLTEISQALVSNLSYLSYLDLSNNTIDFTKMDFNKMIELDYINLSNNNLTILNSNIFKTNYKLQKIILDHNNFTVMPKFVCASGSFETYLYSCSNCSIASLAVDTFKQFPALITINLSHNYITSANLSAFNHLRSLIELNLSHNNITSLSPNVFSKSTALEKLYLAYNQISSIDPITFDHNRVLKTLDLKFCSLTQIWNQPIKNAISSLRELMLANNNLSTITVTDLSVISSIEVLDISNNPFKCDKNLTEVVTWLNEHDVSPVKFKTHDEVNDDGIVFDATANHFSWRELAKDLCSPEYFQENYEKNVSKVEIIQKITKTPVDYDEYHYGDFDSDEDANLSDEFDTDDQFGKDPVGIKISEIISSSKTKKGETRYSFLWPTLVFIFTSLSVLVIAANIMLLMLRSTAISRKINIPHIKIPQWSSSAKLKKHSGSVYQPLSEEKYDSCIQITGKEDHAPIHKCSPNNLP